MLYKSSYNDIAMLVSYSQERDHVAYTSYLKKTLELIRTAWMWIRVVFPNAQTLSAHQRQKSLSYINLLEPQEAKLSSHPITNWWKNQIIVSPKHIIVIKVDVNGLTSQSQRVFTRESL